MTRPSPFPRPNPYLTVFKLVGVMLAAAVLCAGLLLPYVGGLGLAARSQADKFLNTTCDLQESAPPEGTTLYASDGKTVLATIFDQDRQPVPLSMVPLSLQKALIDTEDRRFYQHHGVDMRGLLRSALNNSSDDSTQGGSTLTMQYVKQSRYYKDDGNAAAQAADISQTITRKLQDAKCAIELEKRESKATILDNYLNIAFFGENSYSIESAAQTYFATTVNKLTLPQSAMLVGILQAPTSYDPFQNPVAARDRRNQVIENMVTAGDLTEAQAKVYEATPVSLATTAPPTVQQGCYNAPTSVLNVGFFCSYVESWLEQNEGITSKELSTGGLKIVTTLNPGLQDSAQAALSAKFPAAGPTTALMPMVDPSTGNVLAMISSKPYGLNAAANQIATNPMIQYSADAASTYKYFTMVAALEAGAPPTLAITNNVPAKKAYQTGVCTNNPFLATNGDQNEKYTQTETMQSAIAKSSNTYFVGLEDGLFGCDLTPITTTIANLGMTNLLQKDPEDTSGKDTYAEWITAKSQSTVTLGEFPTDPLELTGAFAAAANDGVLCTPAPIISITDQTGKQIAVKRTPCAAAMTPQVARTAVSLLTGDTSGDGTSAKTFKNWNSTNKSQIAGKTGTDTTQVAANGPQLNTSLWFVGVTPHVVATMVLMKVGSPETPLSGLPGLSTAAAQTTADGAVAATYWLDALGPTLAGQHWNWPSANSVAGSVQVPSVVGMPVAQATSTLIAHGYKVAPFLAGDKFPTECGSSVPAGDVAYFSPAYAAPGTTVTICTSNGGITYKPYTAPPPPPKPTVSNTPSPGVTTPGGPGHPVIPPGITPPGGGH